MANLGVRIPQRCTSNETLCSDLTLSNFKQLWIFQCGFDSEDFLGMFEDKEAITGDASPDFAAGSQVSARAPL